MTLRRIGRTEFELLKNAQLDEGFLPRGYLSPSSIGKLQKCGEQFRRYYVEGESGGPPNAKMQLGTDVHGMVEDFCTLFFRECKHRSVEPLEVTVRNRVDLFPTLSEVIEFSEPTEEAQKIYSLWHKEMLETLYVPLESENTHYCALGDVPIMCKIDLVIHDLATSTNSVIDLKVGVKKRTPGNSIQLYLYSAATGHKSVGYWQMVPPKIRVGAKSILSITEVDNAFIKHVSRVVQSTADTIMHKTYTFAAPDDWACTDNFCGHYKQCRLGENND
jgi:hypothetical protein